MEAEIIKLAASQGLFAVLFVALLFYVLKTTKDREMRYQQKIDETEKRCDEREEKYRNMVNSLLEKQNVLKEIGEDVKSIKGALRDEGFRLRRRDD